MKRRYKITIVSFILLLVISLSLNIVSAVGQGAEPGSDQDPIVSKSYVDAAIAQLSIKVQSLLDQNNVLTNQNAQLTTRLTTQEQLVKALQDELKAVKTSVAAGAGGAGNTGGTGNTGTNQPASIGKATVNVAALNVRSQTNTTSAIVAKVLLNETVTLVSKAGDWYKIITSKGKSGYVMCKFVTVKK
ncbi:MAG: SH3 domain-containing protein [Clostridiaceae bacterium]